MKKLSIVLMILLIAGGSLFAADINWSFSGRADSGVKFDLDAEDYGMYYATRAKVQADIPMSKSGSGDMYGSITINFREVWDTTDGDNQYTLKPQSWSAAIHAGDLKIGFGSPTRVGPWVNGQAAGYANVDVSGNGSNDDFLKLGFTASPAGNLGQGLTLTYDVFTLAAVYRDNAGDVDMGVVAKYADSIEGLTVNVDVGFVNEDFFGTFKVATDLEGWGVWLASDLKYDGALAYEVAAGVSGNVEAISVGAQAVYGTDNKMAVGVNAGVPLSEGLALSARVYSIDPLNADGFPLGVSGTLTQSTMIDGATLNLGYSNSDIANKKGSISAYARISL